MRAADAQNNLSGSSNARLGVAIAFTDPTLVSGVTVVKAAHVTELRQAVNTTQALAGLPQTSWTDAVLLGVQIKAVHVTELRTKLTEALQALSLTVPGFSDAQLAGVTIKKLYIEELRAGLNSSGAGDGGGGGGSTPIPVDGLASVSYNTATNRINSAGWEYDAAGNQTRVQRTDGSWQRHVYDAAGRLVKVQNDSNITQIIHTYGASNHRLIEQVGNESSNQRTYYGWAGDSVIAEYEETASAPTTPRWVKSYVYLGGRLLATIAPNGQSERVEYHHPDRLGTRLVTNNQDTSSFEQVTLPFGRALDAESNGSTKRRFTSYDRSSVTGLDYAVNRHYDPLQGRFTQVDPIGMSSTSLANPQTLNLYAYCANDPINRTDPSGLGFFSWLGNAFKKIVHAIFKAVAVAVLTFITSGGNFKRAIVAGVRAFIDEFRVNTGWQPSGGWGRTPPTFGSGPTLRQILGQTSLGRRLSPDKRWFLTPGIAGNGLMTGGFGALGGTLRCNNWGQQWKDMNAIAKTIQRTAFAWTDGGATFIRGVTKSHNETVGMFDTLTLGDPHWAHWGGADRKVLLNDRWYHITVGYGSRTEKQWRKIGPERELFNVEVRDNDQIPSWITIHCEDDEPGSLTHLINFLGLDKAPGRMISKPWTIP